MQRDTRIEPSSPATSFESEARAALESVRSALKDVVGPVLGGHNLRAADLVGAFALDNRLAWRFVKILTASDVLASAKYLPGERGVGLLLRAAARRNAPRPAIEAARRAFAVLEEFIEREAGDRRSFNMMVTGHTSQPDEGVAVEHRKGAFEHNGFIWGVQARVQVHSYLVRPSGDGEHVDLALIRGLVDLRRLRSRVPWRVSRFYSVDQQGSVHAAFERQPLDPDCGPDDVPLLRPFCTQPLPSVRRQVGPHGVVEFMLAESEVGNAQSVTCLTGEIIRRAEPCHPTSKYPELGTFIPLRTPCELGVMDVFLDHTFFGTVTPVLRFLSDLFNETLSPDDNPANRLPCPFEVERLSDGPQIPRLREFDAYDGVIRFCFDRLGWDPARFSCYRVRLPFPPIPATLVADFPLPARVPG